MEKTNKQLYSLIIFKKKFTTYHNLSKSENDTLCKSFNKYVIENKSLNSKTKLNLSSTNNIKFIKETRN